MERNDLKTDIEKFINNELKWYDNEIGAVKDNQRLIDFLNERKGWLEEEKQYKNQLVAKMEELSKALAKGNEPPKKLSDLTYQCFNNVKDKCQANCKQDSACHDKLSGCQPDKCSGGNPCPTDEIQQEISKIQSLEQEVKKICEEIVSIINNIQKQKTPQIIL